MFENQQQLVLQAPYWFQKSTPKSYSCYELIFNQLSVCSWRLMVVYGELCMVANNGEWRLIEADGGQWWLMVAHGA